jgi:hypothetical protein
MTLIVQISKILAQEFLPLKIRVNQIAVSFKRAVSQPR